MTLNTLSAFLTLVEEMNFTRAAQRLFITQQSLSGHIKRLEEEYGVVLFDRRPTLRLTAEGENMVFYARQILQAQNAMISDFADLSSRREANLNLGISYMRSAMMGAGIWKKFRLRHPNIRIRMVEKNTTALLEDLQKGDISMMVGVDIRHIPGLRIIPLMQESLCCVVGAELFEKYGTGDREKASGTIHLRQLGDVPVMFPALGNRLRTALERMYRTAGVRPRILLESERQDVLYQLASEGEGAAFLSPMVLYDRRNGEIVMPENCHVFRLPEAGMSTLSIAVPEDVRLPHYADSMIEVIREMFAGYAQALSKAGLLG